MRYVTLVKLVRHCLAFSLVVTLCGQNAARADIYGGYNTIFGEIVTAREAGMGDCASTNVGPDALLYNPGAYGVFFLDHNFEISAPIPQKLLPEIFDDFKLFALNAGIRIDRSILGKSALNQPRWAVAIGVSHIRTTLPSYYWYWYPSPYENEHLYSTGVTLAAAWDGRLRIGVGSSLKFLTSDLNNFGTRQEDWNKIRRGITFDAGLYADFDLFSSRAGQHDWSVVPAAAIVFANSGKTEFSYSDPFVKDQIPHLIRYSTSLKITRWRHGREGNSLRGIYERDNWTGPYYEEKIGGEAGLANAFFVRVGKVYTKNKYERKPVTWGVGFSMRGFLDWAKSPQPNPSTARESFWNRCDLRFDYGHYPDDKDEAEANTNFFRVTVAM